MNSLSDSRKFLPAGEYHEDDFNWEEHVRECEPIVHEHFQRRANFFKQRFVHLLELIEEEKTESASLYGSFIDTNCSAHLSRSSEKYLKNTFCANPSVHAILDSNLLVSPESCFKNPQCASNTKKFETILAADEGLEALPTSLHVETVKNSNRSWEYFYQNHHSSKVYQERRYLLLEFSILRLLCENDFESLSSLNSPTHDLGSPSKVKIQNLVLEIGCGHGSSLIPILLANPRLTGAATDVSTTCLTQLVGNAKRRGLEPLPIRLPVIFSCDGSSPLSRKQYFEGLEASVVLLIFTLSAVPPLGQLEMLRNAAAALRSGGQILVRDHGLYDMVQMRHCSTETEEYKNNLINFREGVSSTTNFDDSILSFRSLRSIVNEPNLYAREGEGTLAYFFSTDTFVQLVKRVGGLLVRECRYARVENFNRKTGRRLKRVFLHAVLEKEK
uniref:Methyltransferase-like protein n=1 Tax=Polytomella parva TaxID=51329 RepID=A0A7S0V012_9CHLO|mmetsp:Transcript_20158/g.36220  ORF Transcript_20158/g.36220 Transcript_20158/m.36220 type:complete len:444 (+) Transcript_20158:144-1475(+)